MIFKDLSLYDLNLIKSNAIDMLVLTKVSCRYEALVECTLACIYYKAYKITPYPDKLRADLIQTCTRDWDATRALKELDAIGVIEFIFKYLADNNLIIEKDESREPLWNGLTPGVYTAYHNPKKPWQY